MNMLKKEKTHIVFILVTFVLFIASMRIMRFYSNNLLEYSNEKILDLRMGYSFDETNNYLMELTEDGRNFYKNKFHFIDTIYPIIYCVFYITILSYLIKKCFQNNKKINLLLVLPIIGTICDYGENVLINNMIKNYNNISVNIVNISSRLTIIKFIAVYSSLALAIIFLIVLIIKKINGIRRNYT